MTDDRSERLRKRRKQSANQTEQHAKQAEGPSKPDKPSQQHENSDAAEVSSDVHSNGDEKSESIKDKQVGTYMYLPESQTKDMRRLYNVLKAEYEFEYDEDFEKNRHFYPLVIQYGLESLEGMDASEIRTCLEELV